MAGKTGDPTSDAKRNSPDNPCHREYLELESKRQRHAEQSLRNALKKGRHLKAKQPSTPSPSVTTH